VAEEPTIYLAKDVFVAGATPRVTYNPRDERHLERELPPVDGMTWGRCATAVEARS
jgi:hypothetical protein